MSTTAETVLWVVDRDYIDAERIGYGQTLSDSIETTDSFNRVIGRTVHVRTGLTASAIPAEYRVRFRSLDDDGEVYYGGCIDARALDLSDGCTFDPGDGSGDEGECDYAYNLDRWATADAGAIHTTFKRSDLIAVADNLGSEKVRAWVENHPGAHADLGGDEWIQVYG